MAPPDFARLALAIVAAAAVHATVTLLYFAFLAPGAAASPYFLAMVAIGLGPQAFFIVVPLIFLTRYLARRGFSGLAVMILVGAALGPMPELVGYLHEQITYAQPRPFGDGLETSTVLGMVVAMAVSGALASAVYWFVLDPPAYYRQS